MRNPIKSEKGQGTTEYIVILGIVVAIAMALVWGKLQGKLGEGVDKIGNAVSTVGNLK